MSEHSSRLDPERERRLGEAVAAYLAAIEAGGTPDRAAILAANPDLASDLSEFFDEEERFGRLVAPFRSTEPDAAELGEEPTLGEHAGSTTGVEPFPIGPSPGESTLALPMGDANGHGDDALARGVRVRYFGDYELSTVLGRGGMGIVYKANQLSLNRVVALKMIRSGHWADDDEVRRFRNEAEAVANLDHPLILPIYEVGRYEDQHYFSMKLVPGGSLEARLGEFQADIRAAAKLVAEVARAVHHAHQRGLLHRDLKPSNILLDAEGRPHVTDFGLAKRIDGAASVSGSIVGTPSYMSPEQAMGRRSSVTTATDVYGLGALLYACLTGRPPFQGDDVVATLHLVTDQPPEPPSKSNPQVDPDLETICLKCLDKDPKRRYDSASALADDLERWLRGEPILARRTGGWERFRKWSRRHPARAALAAMSGVAALTLVGLGVALFIHSQLRSAYDEVERQRGIAEAALASERTFLYQNRVMFAERELNDDNNIKVAEQLLEECPESLRGWEWHYLRRQCHLELMSLSGHVGAAWGVATSPDGLWIASGGIDKTVRIREAATGKLLWNLEGHEESVYSVAFSPDGRRLASASGAINGPGRLLVHEVETGRAVVNQPLDLGYGCTVRYGPNGRSLVVASGARSVDGWVRVLDAESGRVQNSMPVGTNVASSASLSPDGTRLLVVCGMSNIEDPVFRPNQVEIWNLASGRIERRFEGHTSPVMDAAVSPDGRRIAAAGYDMTVRIWDFAEGRLLKTCRGHRGCINSLTFSRDGRRVATACDDNSAKVWDVETGEEQIHLRGHRGPVWGVAFTPDGRRLATTGAEGDVKVFDVTSSREAVTFVAHPTRANGVLFSPDGRWLVTYGMDRSLKVWELSTGRILATWIEHTDPVWCAAFSPDGRLLASAAGDWSRGDRLGEIIVRDSVSGDVKHTLKAHRGIAWTVSFSPDGRLLATGGGEYRTPNQEVVLWDIATGREVRRFPNLPGGVTSVVFTPDGRRIIASSGKAILGWEVETGRSYGDFAGHEDVINHLAMSPDGRWLVSASDDNVYKFWDAASGLMVRSLIGPTYRTGMITISPDGKRIAAASLDETVRVWGSDSGQNLLTIRGHHTYVWGVAFSPDGRLIASCDQNGMVKLWNGSPIEGGAR